MLNRDFLEQNLAELPLLAYGFADPNTVDFAQRVRHICRQECPMYGKTWACPPAVGSVEECRERCLSYSDCLVVATVTEVRDIANIEETLATRPGHEAITNQVGDLAVYTGEEVNPMPEDREAWLQKIVELAKENNSTIDAICRLNELTGEPAEDVMLLIPVE